ncbi:MAG: magnesium transporter CorA family protein [Bacilli bacterium]
MLLRVYKEEKGTVVSTKKDPTKALTFKSNSWIDVVDPDLSLLKKIAKRTALPLDFLSVALDLEESGRIDVEEDSTLIVLDSPFESIKEDKKHAKINVYNTIPFVIVYNDKYIVTLRKYDTGLVDSVLNKYRVLEPHKHARFTLSIFFCLAQQFISYLKRIDVQSKDIEMKLHNSMKNKELFDLMSLNKELVYFSTALNSNAVVSERLKRLPLYKMFEEDTDLIEDVQVEFNQASEMCSIYRDILAGMMDAFASIISNNLNIVMKVLAIVTIVLSIPTIVASFYGMNVKDIPLAESNNGFWIIVGVSAGLAIIGALVLLILGKLRKK